LRATVFAINNIATRHSHTAVAETTVAETYVVSNDGLHWSGAAHMPNILAE